MTKKGTQQKPDSGESVHFLIPLDSTLEQCEAIAAAFRQYAREHPDAHDPRTARRSAIPLHTSSQEPGRSEKTDEKSSPRQ